MSRSKADLIAARDKARRELDALTIAVERYDSSFEQVKLKGLRYSQPYLADYLVFERADGQELFIAAYTSIDEAFA